MKNAASLNPLYLLYAQTAGERKDDKQRHAREGRHRREAAAQDARRTDHILAMRAERNRALMLRATPPAQSPSKSLLGE